MRLLNDYWQAVSGNVLAEPLCAVLTLAATWPFRHRIGAGLAAWWARHHHEHAVAQHLEALTRFAAGEDGRPRSPKEGK